MGRQTLTGIGLTSVQAKRLQRHLEQPAVVACAPPKADIESAQVMWAEAALPAEAIAPLPPAIRGSNI